MKTFRWGDNELSTFYRHWPCCDVPQSGWAVFDDNGDLVDISPNTHDCESSGGLSEFLDSLKGD